MAGDLGASGGQVHRQAEAVRHFWLEEVPEEKRFAVDPALDVEIGRRFAALRAEVLRSHAAGWRSDPHHLLAAVILIDQFSRNLFRGQSEAFAGDPLARTLAGEAATRGWGDHVSQAERQFLWMPFMHSESMAGQVRSLTLYEANGAPEPLQFARLHAAQVARFGRFPQRNAALGRESTAEERAFLEDPANHF